MSKRSIPPQPPQALKDEKGAYLPMSKETPPPPLPPVDLSIDSLMEQGLLAIQRALKGISTEITTSQPNNPPREAIMNLKDCMAMLESLKKREQELLEGMSDEEIQEYLNKRQK